MKTETLLFRWRPLPLNVERRISRCLSSWLHTPYMEGQQAKGIAVDCVQFVGAFLDEMYGNRTRTRIPRLRADAAQHSVRAAFQTIKALRSHFPTFVARDDIIEPGDIVVVRASTDSRAPKRPGHVLIAAPGHVGSAFHADGHLGEVCQTSLAATSGILRIYRPKEKCSWAC